MSGFALRPRATLAIIALALTGTLAPAAEGSAAREYLEQARTAARAIELSGDQSAALRSIACVLADTDPQSALDIVGTTRRPSDAARSLAAVARNLATTDPETARQAATTAGRLVLRIAGPEHRLAEQRLLLREMAALGEDALVAALEVPPEEGQLSVVLGRAESDPEGALELMRSWGMTGLSADRALMAVTPGLVHSDPDRAVELTATIGSTRLREQTLWLIAERLPAAEEAGVAERTSDWLIKSAMLASAAERAAASNPEAALGWAQEVSAARTSALAQMAVALAVSDRARAIALAESLPDMARRWTLARIAVELARSDPEDAETILKRIEGRAAATRMVATAMAAADADRAIRLVDQIPVGESRDAALAGVAGALATSDLERAAGLVWSIESPRWKAIAVKAVTAVLARHDCDAATSLIGLVSDPELAYRLRAEVAAVTAAHDPEAALMLLESLPASDYRSEAAMEGAKAILSAGGAPEEALRLAAVGLERDEALRWLVPSLARSRTRSPIALAEEIESAYLRAISLADAAREAMEGGRSCPSVPERARQVRPIVEWEGR